MLSTQPADMPARIPLPVDSLPEGSTRKDLMVSKVRKRTLALNAVP